MIIDIIMLYPDEYHPTEKQVRMWYSDAVANGECNDIGDWKTANLIDIIDELNANADITLAYVKTTRNENLETDIADRQSSDKYSF